MSASLHVAVIARPGAPLEACLAALAAAGVAAPAIVDADERGLAVARNRALQECDGDVLALLEDDVAVAPNWRAALEAAWAAADERLACVGGPLRAGFSAGRPPWFSDALLGVLGIHDERAETFHAGNVSFRAAALRGVGGFWPARGHPDGRDWFSDEHEAQRELRRAGWASTFAAGAAATRLAPAGIDAGTVLRRRLRYGARMTLLDTPRTRAWALRVAAAGAAGAPLALRRGDAATALERAARAAENVGALLGARIAHADTQPVARETPFCASVPPPQRRPRVFARAAPGSRRRRAAGREAPLVLLYHRVAHGGDRLGMRVAPDHFAAQLDVLRATRPIVSLEAVAGGQAPPGAVAVTFDDGYADNLHAALPALRAARVPATLFATTGHIASGAAFWWDELDRLLHGAPACAAPILTLELTGQRRSYAVAAGPQRRAARALLHAWLQPLDPGLIAGALQAVAAWAGEDAAARPPRADSRPMSVDELRRVARAPGLSVGAHTRRHPSLRHADPATQEAEIAGSRDDLAAWLGSAPTAFSYPFGVPGADVDAAVARRVRAAGFTCAVVNASCAPRGDRFQIARRMAPDLGGEAFAVWLRLADRRTVT
jgi:peptidoglycan/xylan/chitin deacetylase (PgdA/CDA1 family)